MIKIFTAICVIILFMCGFCAVKWLIEDIKELLEEV